VAGLVGTRSGSVLAFAVTVLLAALVVAVLDLVANLSAEWHGLPTDAERRSSLVGTAWELLTANVVVIAVVGGLVSGVLFVLPRLR